MKENLVLYPIQNTQRKRQTWIYFIHDDQAPKVLIQVDIEFVFDRHPPASSHDLAAGPN